jgi:hypothetical protein
MTIKGSTNSKQQIEDYVKSIKLATDLHAIHFQQAAKNLVSGQANRTMQEASKAHGTVMQIFRNSYELGKLVGNDEDLEQYATKLVAALRNE